MPIVTTANLEYKITNVNINATDLTIKLSVARGIVENGGFTVLDTHDLDINQADTKVLVLSPPIGATLYDALKACLYQYLVDKSLVIGTIS
jgi:hypothetical protein